MKLQRKISLKSTNANKLKTKEDLVSMYDETFNVEWDENDVIQLAEDDWVSSVLGTEEEAIYDVLAEIK